MFLHGTFSPQQIHEFKLVRPPAPFRASWGSQSSASIQPCPPLLLLLSNRTDFRPTFTTSHKSPACSSSGSLSLFCPLFRTNPNQSGLHPTSQTKHTHTHSSPPTGKHTVMQPDLWTEMKTVLECLGCVAPDAETFHQQSSVAMARPCRIHQSSR